MQRSAVGYNECSGGEKVSKGGYDMGTRSAVGYNECSGEQRSVKSGLQ